MNRQQRYRRRLKLQAALLRVLEVLADNTAENIPPDRTTALMSWGVVRQLLPFIQTAGLDPEGLPDLTRFLHLKQARQKETHKRYRRHIKRRKAKGSNDKAPPP